MIDVSTMAPVSGIAGIPGTPGIATAQGGAAGFLRLFEIVLGGMPGVAAGAVSPESVDGLASAIPTAPSSPGIETLLDTGEATSEATIPMVDAARIAELLGLLGFQVQPADIQALGGMDRFQLDQAMEFLERGVVAGVAPDALLENAGYLMPGEWDLLASNAAAPRSTELAPAAFTSEGLDPAAILAAAQAIRGLLAPNLVNGEMASLRMDASLPEAVAATPMAPSRAAPVSPLPQVLSGPRGLVAPAVPDSSRVGSVAVSEVRGMSEPSADMAESETGKVGEADPPAVPLRPVTPPAVAPPRSGLTEIVQRSHPESLPAKVASAAEGIVVSSRGTPKEPAPGAEAPVVSGSTPRESGALAPVGAVFEAPRSLEDPSSVRGIKPGSMASEFIGRQVLEKVDVQLRQGRRELTVRLWPEELGEVRLSLRVGEADRLDARILVQTESVRQAILDATPQLREALSRHGMEMGRLSVSVDSGAPDSRGGSGTAGQERPRDGQQRPREQAAWREESVAYASTLALGIDSGIRDGRNTLDMWS